jgi:formylmethanofuran dehydrogenase subunit D
MSTYLYVLEGSAINNNKNKEKYMFIGTAISTKEDDMNDLLLRANGNNIIHHLYTILAYVIL